MSTINLILAALPIVMVLVWLLLRAEDRRLNREDAEMKRHANEVSGQDVPRNRGTSA